MKAGILDKRMYIFDFKVLLMNSAEQIYSKQFLNDKDWIVVITKPLSVELKEDPQTSQIYIYTF